MQVQHYHRPNDLFGIRNLCFVYFIYFLWPLCVPNPWIDRSMSDGSPKQPTLVGKAPLLPPTSYVCLRRVLRAGVSSHEGSRHCEVRFQRCACQTSTFAFFLRVPFSHLLRIFSRQMAFCSYTRDCHIASSLLEPWSIKNCDMC